ncbi:MAG TPA: FecR family protein [Polyangiaceae bacterium]
MIPTGSREERALASVTAEARRTNVPHPGNAAASEERLMSALRRERAPSLSRRTKRALWVLVPAAVFSVALLWLRQAPESADTRGPLSPDRIDGDALTGAHELSAGDQPLQIHHPGRAEWTLEPGSRARVLESAQRVRVSLLRGALRASVIPGQLAESFVVETRETRVAVHGTVFRVSLRAKETLVQVEQGVVSVDARADDAPPTFLTAPASARFTPDGVVGRAAAEPQGDVRPSAPRKSGLEAPRLQTSSAPSATVARELTIGEVEAGIADVVEAITRCFEKHTPGAGDVTIRARTAITLQVTAEGSVREVRFSPPLSPETQACAEQDAKATRFAAAGEPSTITRVLELSR